MENEFKKVEIFTDGACSGNPGCGGWGAILKYSDNFEKSISGSEKLTTNNRMELTAFIKALEILDGRYEVLFYSDSKYIVDSLEKGWLMNWEKKNWKRDKNKEVLNRDLWELIIKFKKIHKITAIWVKGHAGHLENEKCDQMATQAIKNLKLGL